MFLRASRSGTIRDGNGSNRKTLRGGVRTGGMSARMVTSGRGRWGGGSVHVNLSYPIEHTESITTRVISRRSRRRCRYLISSWRIAPLVLRLFSSRGGNVKKKQGSG